MNNELRTNMGKTLRIALMASLGIHILAMSAVSIVTPGDLYPIKPYTKIDFLGPILRKTAFDIMLENVDPVVRTTYRDASETLDPAKDFRLEVRAPRREIVVNEFPEYLENSLDVFASNSLKEAKGVPDFYMGFDKDSLRFGNWAVKSRSGETVPADIIYKPEQPFIARGIYGDNKSHKIVTKVLVNKDGNVRAAELVTTTGYPELDMLASEYVRRWIFEPQNMFSDTNEWYTVEVVLKTGDR